MGDTHKGHVESSCKGLLQILSPSAYSFPSSSMVPLQKLVLPRNAHVILLSRHGSSTRSFLRASRFVHTPANDNPKSPSKPKPKPVLPHQTPLHPASRHEVHERSESLTVPGFNPPGGGGGPGPGGSSVFQITRSPFFDAVLTTVIGIGMGEWYLSSRSHVG
jgi:hypothetical protein